MEVQRGWEGSPGFSNAKEVWTHPVFPWIQQSGPNHVLDCGFTWPKAKLVLRAQAVGTGMARGGVWGLRLLHWPAFSWLPLRRKGLCSSGRKESSGSLCKFFDLISCCCSVSLMVSGAVTWTDAVLLCWQKMKKLFVFSVAGSRCWQGPAPVLSSQSTAESQWCSSQAGGKGWGWSFCLSLPKPCNPVDASLLYSFNLLQAELLLRDPIFPSLFLIQSLSFCLSYVLDS